ncbi:hypothetical protein ACFE04_013195 [Oxalis oulophora]
MATNEEDDQSKPTSAEASSSSSSSSPLLYKPPSPPTTTEQPDPYSDDPNQYLQISYNYEPSRPFKDLPFLIIFTLFLLSTFIFGIFSIFNRNSNYPSINSYSYSSNSSSCVITTTKNTNPSLLLLLLEDSNIKGSSFFNALISTLVVTFILAIPICYALLLLLKHYTKQLVYVSLPFFIVLPLFFDIYWFVACTLSSSCSRAFPLAYRILLLVFVVLIIGVILWIFVANWHRIQLTIDIIGVASDALSKNLGLFVVLPLLTFGLVVYYAPIVVFLVFARFNGKVVPEYDSGNGEYSCVWKQDGWVPAYYALAILTMLWSLTNMVEAQAYVISGTVAQWYFSKEDTRPKKSIRSSLRNAFGPSAGTVCLSGLLICVVRLVRAAVESTREEVPGFVHLILRCFVNALLSSIDFLNKFTINFAAITGEAYCSSAKLTYELLRRNLLSAAFVETVSTRLLSGLIFVLSATYAIVVCAILKGAGLGVDSYFVAILAWALLILVLGFFIHVLDNVIDTVYVCYAVDKDRGEVYKPDVHEVYVHLPITRNSRSYRALSPEV